VPWELLLSGFYLPERAQATKIPDSKDFSAEQTYSTLAVGALNEVRLLALPMFVGDGLRLTPALRSNISLTFADARTWPHGVIELTYRVDD
jgi:hypothetical protein